MQKNLDARRLQVTQNAAMTPEQKNQALQVIGIEHQQMLISQSTHTVTNLFHRESELRCQGLNRWSHRGIANRLGYSRAD